MKAQKIKGMAVVSITDGAKLGYIDDLLFDPKEQRLAALRVSADNQAAVIPFADVRSVGTDAVTVPSNDVRQWTAPSAPLTVLPNLEKMSKLKVVDEAGTLIGTVDDIEIDPQDGRISEVHAHRGGVLGVGGHKTTVTAKDVISIGDDVMVVRAEAPPSD